MKTKARRSHFLLAAELVYLASTGQDSGIKIGKDECTWVWPSRYCCDNLSRIDYIKRQGGVGMYNYKNNPECKFINEMFYSPDIKTDDVGGWWEQTVCDFDPDEPRILAMLLCAEMLRR